MKNRKANIPVMILVIGIFLACTILIISFKIKLNELNNEYRNIKLIEYANSRIDEIHLYKDLGYSNQDIVDMMDGEVQIENNGLKLNVGECTGNIAFNLKMCVEVYLK